MAEARAVQERLRSRVVSRGSPRVRYVAGADVSYDRGSPILYAAVVVLDVRRNELIDIAASNPGERLTEGIGRLVAQLATLRSMSLSAFASFLTKRQKPSPATLRSPWVAPRLLCAPA